MVTEGGSSTLQGFSVPVPYLSENLSGVEDEPGVHVVWNDAGELIYVGHTRRQKSRLRQHLNGDRSASIFHDKVGRLLDQELGREASRDDIRAWLGNCKVAWKADPDPKSLKARIVEEFHPVFNEIVPTAEHEAGQEYDVWGELVYWVRYFKESPDFDEGERDYKIRLGEEFATARTSALAEDQQWLGQLRSAFKSKDNNLSRWNQHDQYLDWVADNPEAALVALKAIWSESDVEVAITQWSDLTPKEAASGQGTRTMLASLLLLGVDPTRYPPFKPMALEGAYRLVGYDIGDTPSESLRYQAALQFFDRVVDECAQREVHLRDRLDAQGAIWSILNVDPTLVDEPERLAAFRGEPLAKAWWVNQGKTYDAERNGGYVWAPQRTERGAVLSHWLNVSKLRRGDIVIHYANGAVRAISQVRKGGAASTKPDELGQAWQQDGYRADVKYFDLEQPIHLDEIPEPTRISEAGPFNRHGGVNQGYMFSLSSEFVEEFRDLFEGRWPLGSPWEPFSGSYWIFQGNPDRWDFDGGLAAFDASGEGSWTATQYRGEMAEGDRVAIWRSGPEAGVYALAEIAGEPFIRDEDERLTSGPAEEWAVPLRNPELVVPPILRSELLSDPVLGELDVIRIRQGTNFRVSGEQWKRLQGLIAGSTPENVGSLSEVVGSVSGGLLDAGLGFGSGHLGFVRSFVVSLATKGFVLLTGLTGSGKSRLAKGFGEWLGAGRFWLEAVRPDWTGPDELLGYRDGLSERDEHGRLGWHVPGVLEFMLGAADDVRHPYLLLLDEMNLAHVERYFADVLSGMESEEPVLPNLVKGEDGVWREVLGGPSRLMFPSNLMVVGTVNIDETTYMFSPKVLDRANTLEFRVKTEDLVASVDPIGSVEAGSDDLVRVFLVAATSVGRGWSGRDEMAGWLRELHGLLAVEDREFGHRVFFEALRFGGLLAEAGESDPLVALDLQVLQKVLPRVHGSIRQVGSTLERLGAWCFYGPGIPLPDSFDPLDPPEGEPRLPVSFDKTARMTRRLRANHFVSYAE